MAHAVRLFRGIEDSDDLRSKSDHYVIIESFDTIDGPRQRVSRHLIGVTPERAMQEFEQAKDVLK